MEMRDLFQDAEFLHREKRSRDPIATGEAFRQLARVFAESPGAILQRLVEVAVEFCHADSAGISLEEVGDKGERRFRWVAIAGTFAGFVQGTTPRFFSPCGTTLERRTPQLYRVTKLYYDFLGIEAEPITDGILIPWQFGETRGTIWAVAHSSREAFDFEDYRLLDGLADFAAIALRHQLQQTTLRSREQDATKARMANELAHELNNPLQALSNCVYLARQGKDVPARLEQAAQEIERIAQLVKRIVTLSKTDEGSALG